MKHLRHILIGILLLLTSCIENSIPYPVVTLQILGVEGEGFTCAPEDINTQERIVTLHLDEQTDISNVKIDKISVTENARSSKPLSGTFDLRTPLYITLSFYQDYEWTIVADQQIERYFEVESQIGAAEIDVDQLTAKAYVPEGTDLSDLKVTRLKLGPADIKSYMKMNGVPMVGVVVIPQPGANHIQIADAVYERMENMKKDLPEDVHYSYGFDNTKFIRASIDEVKQTVYEAFVLVIIIIFLFLRDWRVTLVPCIVIPVSLIGAFFVMYLAGFSINVLSMLAIVLAVGLVVDDAIVMTENIYVRIEKGMPPKEAGIEGAKEIFFAVISTTITLVAVFFPIVFMDGMTGRLFREFSIVVSGSVIISSFAALTFTPMLATKLLVKREKQNWFYLKTEPFFEGMNRLYSRSLAVFLHKRWIALPFVAITIGIIAFLWNYIPAEMAPLEDRSQISINTRGAEGVTYEYIRDYTEDINDLVDSIIPDAESVTARVSSGSGNVRITLKDMKDRDYTQMDVAEKLSAAVQKKDDGSFIRPAVIFFWRTAWRYARPIRIAGH